MKQCMYCGFSVDDSIKICPNCGAPVLEKKASNEMTPPTTSKQNTTNDSNPSPTKKKKKKLPIIIAVVVLLFFSMSMCSGSSSDPIVGEWSICAIMDENGISGSESTAGSISLSFSAGNSGTIKSNEESLDFTWEYLEDVDEDMRAYTLLYNDVEAVNVFVTQDKRLYFPHGDFYFIFEQDS